MISSPLDVCLEEELLDHMITLFWIYRAASLLFSMMAAQSSILTHSMQGSLFLCVLDGISLLTFVKCIFFHWNWVMSLSPLPFLLFCPSQIPSSRGPPRSPILKLIASFLWLLLLCTCICMYMHASTSTHTHVACSAHFCCLYVYGFKVDNSLLGSQLGNLSLEEANFPSPGNQ